MRISDISVSFRTAVMVLVAIIVAGGLTSYLTIPKEANPDIEIPIITVQTIYPGASPADVEPLVTQTIERELQGIEGIDEIRSISTEGVSIIIVEFLPGTSTNEAYQRVRDDVDRAEADLPTDAEEPIVNEVDLSDFPIMTINLAADYPLARLQQVAENLEDVLETVPGVLEVDLIGDIEREVRTNVNLNALHGYNLTYNDIVSAIQRENINVPGGSIDVDRLNYLIRADGEVDVPTDIEDFVVAVPDGNPVYIRDVADVEFSFKDRSSFARLRQLQTEQPDGTYETQANWQDSDQVISLEVKQQTGENILETVDGVVEELEAFPFPSGTTWIITGDESENVRDLISDLENNIISGLIFVVLVLLFFLGVRNAALVAIAVPLSMFVSFMVLQAMGITLNFIVLFTLIVALGILVDNAIVIVENIYRLMDEEGMDRLEAAKEGAADFAGSITVATLTTSLTFAPMRFWPGIIGEFMGFLPLTLIISLLASLFVAVFINPATMAIFGRTPNDPKDEGGLSRVGWYLVLAGLALVAIVLALANWETLAVFAVAVPVAYAIFKYAFQPVSELFMQRLLPRLLGYHRDLLTWVLERDYSDDRAHLRNMWSLGSFTVGLFLGVIGGIIALVNTTAATVLLAPAGLLLGIGVLGIVLHSVVGLLRGGWLTVRTGLVATVLMAAVLGLTTLVLRDVSTSVYPVVLGAPLVVALVGLIGTVVKPPALLTDNRAVLLNGMLGATFGIFGLFVLANPGVEFFPETDPNQVRVNIEAPLGTNVYASDATMRNAEATLVALLEDDERVFTNTENMLSNVGVAGTGDFGGGQPRSELSRVTFNLRDYADRVEPSTTTLSRIREAISGTLPDMILDIQRDEIGPPTGPPVNIEISGPEFDVIADLSEDVQRLLRQGVNEGELEGLVDLQDNLELARPERSINIDRQEAAQYGLSTAQIGETVRTAINGIEASTYRDGDDDYDITVRLAPEDRSSLESLENLRIASPTGEQVPLVNVADFEDGEGLGSITRLNLNQVAVIEGQNAPGFSGPEVLGRVQDYLADYVETEIPDGYTLEYTGEQQDQDEAFGFLLFALGAGIMLIFLVTVAKFNSLSAPIIVLLAIGLSQVGVVLTLVLSQTPFGLMVFIGIISLFGILVNNNIVLLDYIQQLRNRGASDRESIITGGVDRLRPVLLTAMTTILALIPLTFGLNVDFIGLITSLEPAFQFGSENTQFWSPMGTSIIGGLLFALFLTLVIVPTIYSTFESLSRWMGRTLKG